VRRLDAMAWRSSATIDDRRQPTYRGSAPSNLSCSRLGLARSEATIEQTRTEQQ
jgi:hypothetical protein